MSKKASRKALTMEILSSLEQTVGKEIFRTALGVVGWGALVVVFDNMPLDKMFGVDKKHKHRIGLKLINIIHAWIAAPLAVYAMLNEPAMRQNLISILAWKKHDIFARSAMAGVICPLTCSFFATELLLIHRWYSPADALMVPHHILSIVSWLRGMHLGAHETMVLFCIATEFSSPFM
jgi:hypothetical protein